MILAVMDYITHGNPKKAVEDIFFEKNGPKIRKKIRFVSATNGINKLLGHILDT